MKLHVEISDDQAGALADELKKQADGIHQEARHLESFVVGETPNYLRDYIVGRRLLADAIHALATQIQELRP